MRKKRLSDILKAGNFLKIISVDVDDVYPFYFIEEVGRDYIRAACFFKLAEIEDVDFDSIEDIDDYIEDNEEAIFEKAPVTKISRIFSTSGLIFDVPDYEESIVAHDLKESWENAMKIRYLFNKVAEKS
jgi:hypothetical protein